MEKQMGGPTDRQNDGWAKPLLETFESRYRDEEKKKKQGQVGQ